MQAAFVELGLERTAFLHASDIARNPHAEPVASEVEPDIREFVREGQELLVQVLKEPLGTKGARLTTYIAIPSRYLVLTPNSAGIGVSSRIDDETERERLRCLLEELEGRGGRGRLHHSHGGRGRVARGAASRSPVLAQAVAVDRGASACTRRPGALVYEDLPLPLRVLRDSSSPDIARVRVDSEATFAQAQGVRRALRAAARLP